MQSAKRMYYPLLLLPIIVPALVGGAYWLLSHIIDITTLPSILLVPMQILISQLIFGTLPYLLFAAAVVLWARTKTPEQMLVASWFLPITFAWIMFIAFVFVELDVAITMALIAMAYGYFYVLLAHGILKFFSPRREYYVE